MKKILIPLLSLLVLFAAHNPVFTQNQETLFVLKVVTEQANIREKPDLSSPLILRVPQGTYLRSLGKSGEWYLIILKGKEGKTLHGYVHESLVIRVEDISREQIPEIRAPEKKEEKKEEEKTPLVQRIPPLSIPERGPRMNFSFSLYGGANHVSGNDLNRGMRGFIHYYDDEFGLAGEARAHPLHLGYVVGAEAGLFISPQFMVGVGVDYFLARRERLAEYQLNDTEVTFSYRPKIQAFPLRVFLLHYLFPSVYVKAGVELYLAQCSYYNRFDGPNTWEEKSGNAHGWGLGVLGALGGELTLASNLFFVAEISARYICLNRLRGEGTRMNSNGFNSTEEGSLYLYHRLTSNDNAYPQVEVREKMPAAGGEIDPRRFALLNLSGLSFRIGFRITI